MLIKAIETAAESLKSSTDPYYRKKCWEVIKSFLAASVLSSDDKSVFMKFFSHPRLVHILLSLVLKKLLFVVTMVLF